MVAAMALLMVSCQKNEIDAEESDSQKITFRVGGDWQQSFTRSLTADGKDMTDLWAFDYMDGQLMQTIHQVSTDDDFGRPTITMANGQHQVYFVASRGENPSVDAASHSIAWASVRDTFWKGFSISVSASTNPSHSVALDRVVTRLRLSVNDLVPDDILSITTTSDVWYYGLDYLDGSAVSGRSLMSEIDVPEDYHGTTGNLVMSFFGFSNASEWYANLTVSAKNTDEEEIGRVEILDAPFARNRTTEYSGSLFNGSNPFVVSLNTEWEEAQTLTW